MKITNQHFYNELNRLNIQWDRKNENHIIVWITGYKTMDCMTLEHFAMKAGMRAVGQGYDVCGKTYTIFKHKAA